MDRYTRNDGIGNDGTNDANTRDTDTGDTSGTGIGSANTGTVGVAGTTEITEGAGTASHSETARTARTSRPSVVTSVDDTFIRAGEPTGWATHPLLVIVLCQVFYLTVLINEFLTPLFLAARESLVAPVVFVVELVMAVGAYALPYVPVVLWLRYVERRAPFASTGLRLGRRALAGFGAGVGVATVFVAAWIALGLVAGVMRFDRFGEVGAGALGLLLPMLLVTLLLVTVQIGVEELMYRGWMLQAVGARWGVVAGVLVSSAFFTLWHFAWIGVLLPGEGEPHEPHGVLVVNIFLWSIFAALWTLRTGSLWQAVGFHAAALLLPTMVVGVLTPATAEHASAPVILMIDDPSYLLGGAGKAGPFTGLLATAVLLVMAILAAVALYRRRRPPE